MREDDELRLAMVVLGAVHAEYGCTVTLRREPVHRADAARAPGASCGPVGWRARAVTRGEVAHAAWAPRPYEAACRLAEGLDAAEEAVA